jgi:hypothetical protein
MKDIVSREAIPDDADQLQLAAAIRRQVETIRTYAQHALRVYAKSVDIPFCEITDEERAAAAVAIATTAGDMRRNLLSGKMTIAGTIIAAGITERQLAADDQVLHVLRFHELDLPSLN